MKKKHKRIVIVALIVVIFIAFVIYFVLQFLIPYDVLVSVPTSGWLFDTYDTYYEINSKWGITKKTKNLPEEKYILTADAYRNSGYEKWSEWENRVDMTDYSYIKEYDPLMYYDNINNETANIHGYIYYFRTGDYENFYRFSNETHEIKQVPLETIDNIILSVGQDSYAFTQTIGAIEKLGYFDYYQGLNDVMMQYISLNDIKQPHLDLTGASFLFNVVEINGRIFFNSGNRLFEFYPDTLTAKYITLVRGNPKYLSRFSVIGVTK